MNASKVVESVFDFVCSCQTTPASGVSPEEQMSAFQSKKHMHLFPKCQNNSGRVIAFVWKGLSGNASELGLICSWPRNQPWKEDIVLMKACILGTRGSGRQASRHIGSHFTILGRGI